MEKLNYNPQQLITNWEIKMEKHLEYALKIQTALGSLFDGNEEADPVIDPDEFKNDDNLKAFIHALANIVPTNIFNKLTGDDKNWLTFNHVANHLAFDFVKMEKSEG